MAIQWPLALFTLCAGGAGWLLVWVCVNEFTGTVKDELLRYKELLTVTIMTAVGGCCSALHLSHVDRIMGALNHPTSAIFTEIVMVMLVILLCIVFGVLAYRGASSKVLKGVAVVGIVFGVVISYATGAGYMMSAQPNWNTVLMPLSYAATGAAFGSALYLFFVATWKGNAAKVLFPYHRAKAEQDVTVPAEVVEDDAESEVTLEDADEFGGEFADDAAGEAAAGNVMNEVASDDVKDDAKGKKKKKKESSYKGKTLPAIAQADFTAQKDAGSKLAARYALITGIVAAVIITLYALVQGTMFITSAVAFYIISLVGCVGVIISGVLMLHKKDDKHLTRNSSIGIVCGIAASLGFRCFMFAAGTGLLTFISSPDVVNHFFATI
ncbi:MAG: DmsC/YnfH family molybdoenzyme membrane anchor subunit [Coriobacteriales bacterium]|jgi:DMSO reductase anchor subunit